MAQDPLAMAYDCECNSYNCQRSEGLESVSFDLPIPKEPILRAGNGATRHVRNRDYRPFNWNLSAALGGKDISSADVASKPLVRSSLGMGPWR